MQNLPQKQKKRGKQRRIVIMMPPLPLRRGKRCESQVYVHSNGKTFSKSLQLLGYTDDIDIIGRSKRNITAVFSAIKSESADADTDKYRHMVYRIPY